MKPTEEVLQDLTQPSNVSVHSDDALVGKVKAAIAADDEKRKENEPLRRKPALVPILPTELPRQFELTLWDVLHTLARATALSWRGAGRGLAGHWGALKYTQALAGGRDSLLALTDEGYRIGRVQPRRHRDRGAGVRSAQDERLRPRERDLRSGHPSEPASGRRDRQGGVQALIQRRSRTVWMDLHDAGYHEAVRCHDSGIPVRVRGVLNSPPGGSATMQVADCGPDPSLGQ